MDGARDATRGRPPCVMPGWRPHPYCLSTHRACAKSLGTYSTSLPPPPKPCAPVSASIPLPRRAASPPPLGRVRPSPSAACPRTPPSRGPTRSSQGRGGASRPRRRVTAAQTPRRIPLPTSKQRVRGGGGWRRVDGRVRRDPLDRGRQAIAPPTGTAPSTPGPGAPGARLGVLNRRGRPRGPTDAGGPPRRPKTPRSARLTPPRPHSSVSLTWTAPAATCTRRARPCLGCASAPGTSRPSRAAA